MPTVACARELPLRATRLAGCTNGKRKVRGRPGESAIVDENLTYPVAEAQHAREVDDVERPKRGGTEAARLTLDAGIDGDEVTGGQQRVGLADRLLARGPERNAR